MSDIKPNDFRKHAAEDEFFRLAAMEIESEQNEKFLEAQNLPDPSPEVLARMQSNIQKAMRHTRKQKHRATIIMHLSRFIACVAIVCFASISGVYFSVDAARNSINNFVLEILDDHAIIQTSVSSSQSGVALPSGWDGPFYVTWVPSQFNTVQSTELDSSYMLLYGNSSSPYYLSILVWDSTSAPAINTEGMVLESTETIQQAPAQIYTQTDNQDCMLLWAKDDYIIQIYGDISAEDSKKILENMHF